jgi:hypothetical protein
LEYGRNGAVASLDSLRTTLLRQVAHVHPRVLRRLAEEKVAPDMENRLSGHLALFSF